MRKSKGLPRKVVYPDFVGKKFDCGRCGGSFKVTRHTKIGCLDMDKVGGLFVRCPYCDKTILLHEDPHAYFRARLTKFIKSQVAPIKAIEDEKVRLPMQQLLDDFNQLVQED